MDNNGWTMDTKKHVTFNTTMAMNRQNYNNFCVKHEPVIIYFEDSPKFEQLLTPIFDELHRLIIQFQHLNLSS